MLNMKNGVNKTASPKSANRGIKGALRIRQFFANLPFANFGGSEMKTPFEKYNMA